MSSSEKKKVAEKEAEKDKPESKTSKAETSGLLEEDDEFEDFPADTWDAKDEEESDINVWEDNWDDDVVEDDFAIQLSKHRRKRPAAAILATTTTTTTPSFSPPAKRACVSASNGTRASPRRRGRSAAAAVAADHGDEEEEEEEAPLARRTRSRLKTVRK